jgi:hypothetical protein
MTEDQLVRGALGGVLAVMFANWRQWLPYWVDLFRERWNSYRAKVRGERA